MAKKKTNAEDNQLSHFRSSRHIIQSLKSKADAQRSPAEKLADWMTQNLGSISFLVFNIIWFISWIIINLDLIPAIPAFDPFPFGLLTMMVSLEAIILAIFVLISQNRAAKVDSLREEKDLQVDVITEQEITKVLQLMKLLLEKEGIDLSHDKVLHQMTKPTNTEKIEETLKKEVT